MNEDAIRQARDVYKIEADDLLKMSEVFDEEKFVKAILLLKNASNIAATGCGHSGILCEHFAHLMCCINKPAKFISPCEALHGGMGFLKKNDVMIFASRGGKTSELVPMLDVCKKMGVKIIAITENTESVIAKQADVVLKMIVTRETDRFNSQGTTSSTALIAMFHSLQAALIYETGFTNQQFAVIHPGGAVGERINNK